MEPRPAGNAPVPGAAGEGRRAKRASRYSPGDLIADKYRLSRLLGRGGMGEVWFARHEHLKSDLAIKFLERPATPAAAEGAPEERDTSYVLERFRFEAQISAQLGARTRHIVSVHDAGSHAGAPYLAMEYVAGRTLEAVIDELGLIAPEALADILDQVADALTVAHDLGIVHRDIKPSNIMLVDDASATATGAIRPGAITAKVADFGVAKAVRSDLLVDRPKETLEGLLVGSPAYMSPEQLKANTPLDGRSDVWGLGVVAYEALTGWPPFSGSSLAELIVAITTRRIDPPSSLRSELPRALDAWFDRALAKDPDERFPTAKEMAVAFRTALGDRAPRRSRAVVLGAFAAVAATVMVVVGVRWLTTEASEPVESAAPSAPPAEVAQSPTVPPVAEVPVPVPVPTEEPSAARSATLPSEARRPPPRGAKPPTTQPRPPSAPAPPVAAPSATAEPLPPKEFDKSENM